MIDDEKTQKILDCLTKDFRMSTNEIIRQTGISRTTILDRLRKIKPYYSLSFDPFKPKPFEINLIQYGKVLSKVTIEAKDRNEAKERFWTEYPTVEKHVRIMARMII